MNGTVSNLMLLIPLCQHEVLLTRLITLQRSKSFHNHPVNSNFVKYNDFSVILSSDYCGEVNIVIVQLAGNVGYPITLDPRSEEHTSELQSRGHIVCRLLLE